MIQGKVWEDKNKMIINLDIPGVGLVMIKITDNENIDGHYLGIGKFYLFHDKDGKLLHKKNNGRFILSK